MYALTQKKYKQHIKLIKPIRKSQGIEHNAFIKTDAEQKYSAQKFVMFITNQRISTRFWKKGWGFFWKEKKGFTLKLVSGLKSIF